MSIDLIQERFEHEYTIKVLRGVSAYIGDSNAFDFFQVSDNNNHFYVESLFEYKIVCNDIKVNKNVSCFLIGV
jgi:hypothetical protein